MFTEKDILYEDNHLLAVNKHVGDLVQADTAGDEGLEDEVKRFIARRDNKPGAVFLGVVHRIDRPVSGVVLFAKSNKALVRLNEMLRNREIKKLYWAITEELPPSEEGTLRNFIERDGRTNKSHVYASQKGDSKEAVLNYRLAASSTNYRLIEVELITGRHHQIRAQLASVGCPIKGDLKYGAKRSNKEGGISLHSRAVSFVHPVRKEPITITAPVPEKDPLWGYFETAVSN